MYKNQKKFFYSRDQLLPLVRSWRKEGHKVGFTSGGFDLLHYGHVDYLGQARRLCDRLIVAVNSDRSVRATKGNKRPLVGERDRLRIIAALESVSIAFLFDEDTNRENILTLKPDYYFKGGDYRLKNLSSAHYLQERGGEVRTLPLVKGRSTSKLVERILERYHEELPRSLPRPRRNPAPAIFLDRDGVINKEVEYLHDPKDFIFNPGVVEGLKHFKELGYRLVVVTNQAGIGLGYFTREDFYRVNKKMLGLCYRKGIVLDKIYYCPHSLSERCCCRKPGTLLLERAVEEVGIDITRSIVIGDKTSDIACGKALGLTTILVKTGHGGKDGAYPVVPDHTAKDLREAAQWTENRFGKKGSCDQRHG